MPGLLRGMARTAVVAGTATAVSGRVNRRQQQRWGAQEAQQQQQYAPPPQQYEAPPAPAAPTQSRVEKLTELAALKDKGILTDEEFAAEKSRILNG
jgi:hypothetical protein